MVPQNKVLRGLTTHTGKCFAIIVFISLVVMLIPSCQSTPPASNLSASPPLPAPSLPEKWAPDGIIKAGEYSDGFNAGDYEIHWLTNEQYIYIGIRAKTNGWVAIGIKPTFAMNGADIIMGSVKNGQTTVRDLFSIGDYGPHPADTELGGKSDIMSFGGKEENGYTTIEFQRALNTGDKYDKEITRGSNPIIWSFGSDDSPYTKHFTRGTGEIKF